MMQRRSFLLGLLAMPAIVKASSLMAIKPLPALTGAPVGVATFGVDLAKPGEDIYVAYVAEMRADGIWRVLATGETIDDLDTYMEEASRAARMAA